MVAFTFDPAYQSVLVFLSAIIPGVALGWPLLKKTEFSATEKLFLSFFLGMFAVPSLLFIEGLAGIKFSLFLVLADAFIVIAAGALWGIKEGAFSFKLPSFKFDFDKLLDLDEMKKYAVPALLIIAALLTFWIRLQPYSPIYSELDPYFYVYGTGQIVREGMVPLTDDTAWWPEMNGTHRTSPLKMYLEAQWYALYTQGGAYNNYLLFTTSSWLPPLASVFVAFGAYLLVSSLYGRKYGVFAAFAMAFLPSTIFKMSAGVNEAAPVGMMMLFMSMGLLACAFAKKDSAIRLLAALAFAITVASSNFQEVLVLPFAGVMVLQAADYFIRGKKSMDFLLTGAYAFAGLLAGTILAYSIYGALGLDPIKAGPMLMAGGSLAFAAAAYYLSERIGENSKRRTGAIVIGAILALMLLVTPLGGAVRGQVRDYLGATEYKTALERTIAEQNQAGDSFEGEAGFFALVPKSHTDSAAKEPLDIIASNAYAALDLFALPFTFLGNLMFRLMDGGFNLVLGTGLATTTKVNSLFFLFLVSSAIGLVGNHIMRKEADDGAAPVMLLLLLIMVPILYIGVNKIKFTVYAGMMIALAAASGFAEIEKFLKAAAGKMKLVDVQKYLPAAFAVLLLLTAAAEAAGPIGYARIFMLKSFEPRFQDDPAAMAPKAAALCEELKQKGVAYDQMQPLCDAGSKPDFASTMNNQFDSSVCWMLQLSAKELLPQTTAEQKATQDAAASARFRCNRLGDYWVDSMEWMGKNLEPGARVTSWWDYGHWTNYFGDRKTVLRNEHASRGMIGRIAHDYILGSTDDLKTSMNYYDSRYALFDYELIGGINGGGYGGKYGALNYLGCVHEGATSLSQQPGTSDCEWEHSPERLVIPKVQIPQTTCTISESQSLTGVFAYAVKKTGIDYQNPAYCVGEVTLGTGEKIPATYYLDRKDEKGNAVLSKGFIRVIDNSAQDAVTAEMVYNTLPVWPGQNGTWVGGMEDAKTAFYTSNLYRAMFLNDLPGYDLVYTSGKNEIKIYRMKDFAGNKEGKVDPVEAARQN